MKLIADLHTHTVSSGHAYSTIEEYVAAAKRVGLKILAITDHGPAMPGAPHFYHFYNVKMIPPQIDGIRVLRGIEANIVNDEGHLDLANDDLKKMDVVIAALHPACGYEGGDEAKNTRVLLKALNNPHINIIAHPGNPMYPVNFKEVVAAAKDKRVLIEINNSSFIYSRKGSKERCLAIAKEVKRIGWKVALGTDSHISTMLGDFTEALKVCAEAGLTKDDIVNTSEKLINEYILMKAGKAC